MPCKVFWKHCDICINRVSCIVVCLHGNFVFVWSEMVEFVDVKGSHILVTEKYQIKLIDFGIAGLFNSERAKRNTSVGTSLWMAPVREQKRSLKIDLCFSASFSLGSHCLWSSIRVWIRWTMWYLVSWNHSDWISWWRSSVSGSSSHESFIRNSTSSTTDCQRSKSMVREFYGIYFLVFDQRLWKSTECQSVITQWKLR